MATTMYGLGRQGFLVGASGFDWNTAAIQLAFVTSSYSPNYTTDQYLGVAVSSGYIIAQSGTFSSLSSSLGTANAANETVSSVTGAQFAYVTLYSFITNNNSSPLIMNIDTATGLPCTPNGGNIVVQWDSGTNKIFTLCREVDYVDKGAWSTIRDAVSRIFDRTYTGKLWAGVPTLQQMKPTYEQSCAQAAWEEKQAKAREIQKKFGGRIPVFNKRPMDDAVKLALISQLPALVTAVLAGSSAVLAAAAALIGRHNANKLQNMHVDINSRVDQLVKASKDTGRIEQQKQDREAS